MVDQTQHIGMKEKDLNRFHNRKKSVIGCLTSLLFHKKNEESLCLLFSQKQVLFSELKKEIAKFDLEKSDTNTNLKAELASCINLISLQKLDGYHRY